MPAAPHIFTPSRRSPTVRAIVRAWRELAGGSSVRDAERRTLLACSGGADSSALVLALAHARRSIVVAHIVHDMRPSAQANADRDAVRQLAESLKLPFVEAHARVRDPAPGETARNFEARARRARYAALVQLAREHRCPYIATAHHAHDQLETMLMRLMRGSGPRGLSGIAPSRPLASGVTLIRPMLTIARADARQLCRECRWEWREDATNADTTLLRAAVRARVIPVIEELASRAARRAGDTARVMRSASSVIAGCAAELLAQADQRDGLFVWPRERLRHQPAAVLGELWRELSRRSGGRRLDRLPARSLHALHTAIAGASTDPKSFALGPIRVEVRAREVIAARRG